VRLLAEYRDKKVWPAFDADKVEELKVTGPDGTFTLKKKDKDWTAVDKKTPKVKARGGNKRSTSSRGSSASLRC